MNFFLRMSQGSGSVASGEKFSTVTVNNQHLVDENTKLNLEIRKQNEDILELSKQV